MLRKGPPASTAVATFPADTAKDVAQALLPALLPAAPRLISARRGK
jgi:hypothetical protein